MTMKATFVNCEFEFRVDASAEAESHISRITSVGREPFKHGGDYLDVTNISPVRFTASGSVKGEAPKALRLGFVQTVLRSVRAAHYDDQDDAPLLIDLVAYTRITGKRDGTPADRPWYDKVSGSALVVSGGFECAVTDKPNYAAPMNWRGSKLREMTIDDEFLTCLVAWDARKETNKLYFLHLTRWTNSHHVVFRDPVYVSLRGMHGHQISESAQIPQARITKLPKGLVYVGDAAADSEVHTVEPHQRPNRRH